MSTEFTPDTGTTDGVSYAPPSSASFSYTPPSSASVSYAPSSSATPTTARLYTTPNEVQTSRVIAGMTSTLTAGVTTIAGPRSSTETATEDSFPLSDLELGLLIACFVLVIVCVIGTIVLCRLKRSMRRMTHTLYPVNDGNDHVYQDVKPEPAGGRGKSKNKVELLTFQHHYHADHHEDEQIESPGITNIPPIPPSSIKKVDTSEYLLPSPPPPLPSTMPGAKTKSPTAKGNSMRKAEHTGIDNPLFVKEVINKSASETSFGGSAHRKMGKSPEPVFVNPLSEVDADDIYEEYEEGNRGSDSINEYTVEMIEEVTTPTSKVERSINLPKEQVAGTQLQGGSSVRPSTKMETLKKPTDNIEPHADCIPFYLDLQTPEETYDDIIEDSSAAAFGKKRFAERQTSLSGLPEVDNLSKHDSTKSFGGNPLERIDDEVFYENEEKQSMDMRDSGLPAMNMTTVDMPFDGESYEDVEIDANTHGGGGNQHGSNEAITNSSNLPLYEDPEPTKGGENAYESNSNTGLQRSNLSFHSDTGEVFSMHNHTQIKDAALNDGFMKSFEGITTESLLKHDDQQAINDGVSQTNNNRDSVNHSDRSSDLVAGTDNIDESAMSESTHFWFDRLTSPDTPDIQVLDRVRSSNKASNFDTASNDSYFLDMDDKEREIEISPLVQKKISSNIYFSGKFQNNDNQIIEMENKFGENGNTIIENVPVEKINQNVPQTQTKDPTDSDQRKYMPFNPSYYDEGTIEKANKIFVNENNATDKNNFNEFHNAGSYVTELHELSADDHTELHELSADDRYSPPPPSSPPPPLPTSLPPVLPSSSHDRYITAMPIV